MVLIGTVSVVCRATPAAGQQAYVREFGTAALLLTSGDTVQGTVRLHVKQDILELRTASGSVKVVPAATVRVFAGAHEQVGQPVQDLSQKPYADKYKWTDAETSPYFISRSSKVGDYYSAKSNALGPGETSNTAQPRRAGNAIPIAVKSDAVVVFRTCFLSREEGGPRTPAFFEQLTNGPVLLLRRRESRASPRSLLYLTTEASGVERTVVSALRKPWRQIPAYFSQHATALRAFIRANHLYAGNDYHVAMLVTYANSLPTPGKAAVPQGATAAP